MAVALFRSQVLAEEFPKLTAGADRAAQQRGKYDWRNRAVGGKDVPDVQMLGLVKLQSGYTQSGPTQWAFDMYGAPASKPLGKVKEQQVFEEEQALRRTLRRKKTSGGLRRVSMNVTALRRASTDNQLLLADLGEFQAHIESKIDQQEQRMTIATRASETLMEMAKATATTRATRRASIGDFQADMRSSKRRWQTLKDTGLGAAHKRLVQRDVAAVKVRLAQQGGPLPEQEGAPAKREGEGAQAQVTSNK